MIFNMSLHVTGGFKKARLTRVEELDFIPSIGMIFWYGREDLKVKSVIFSGGKGKGELLLYFEPIEMESNLMETEVDEGVSIMQDYFDFTVNCLKADGWRDS